MNQVKRRQLTTPCNLDRTFWYGQGKEDLLRAIYQRQNLRKAKNVIFFLGDGMGPSTVTAARIHAGQKMGKLGEEHYLSFEKFTHLGLLKVLFNNLFLIR